MTDLNDFITRYVATWNEPDPDVRRQWIAGTWSSGPACSTGSRNITGTPASKRL
jgi:hypothetical protein